MVRSTKVAHDRHKPYFNPQTQQLGEDMQVGDLVKFVGQLGLGIIVEIRLAVHTTHSHKVLFQATGYDALNGYHWCDPSTLEKICK